MWCLILSISYLSLHHSRWQNSPLPLSSSKSRLCSRQTFHLVVLCNCLYYMAVYGWKCEAWWRKTVKRTSLAELSWAHRRSQAKCQLGQTSYIKQIIFFLLCHIVNILLTELSRSVCENLDLGCVYGPHCVRSVLPTSIKILPYRPPARLIRAK